jgi:tryptophan-rich sensory protein
VNNPAEETVAGDFDHRPIHRLVFLKLRISTARFAHLPPGAGFGWTVTMMSWYSAPEDILTGGALSTRHALFGLAVILICCFIPAWFGSMFKPGEWYANLHKPPWSPPNWIFAPVWTLLYTLMGISAWMIWKRGGLAAAVLPLVLFSIQLVLNGLWSWLFFGLKSMALAFTEIMVLWLAILATILAFWVREPLAAVLLVPYLLWVGFAAFLNFTLWQLNKAP